MTSEEQVEALIDGAVQRLGRLDIMFNNAGVVQRMSDVTDTHIAQFERVISVNLRGVSSAVERQRDTCARKVVGGSSTLLRRIGETGHAKFAVYCASKAGVIAFTQSLALELAPAGVTANSICPGNMATEMHWGSLRGEASLRTIPFDEVVKEVRRGIPLQRHGGRCRRCSVLACFRRRLLCDRLQYQCRWRVGGALTCEPVIPRSTPCERDGRRRSDPEAGRMMVITRPRHGWGLLSVRNGTGSLGHVQGGGRQ